MRCGELIREELALVAPRLIKHARPLDSLRAGHAAELQNAQRLLKTLPMNDKEISATPSLDVLLPSGTRDFAADLANHDNRYAYIGEGLKRTAVRFGWDSVTFAEIRDLNRHRTGTKFCPPVPVGSYIAWDELPEGENQAYKTLSGCEGVAFGCANDARERLAAGDPAHVYYALLGTQYPFEHTTTADKFLYEAELRTGTGAHYRYAQHLRDVLELWFKRFPETRGLVLEGSAEPE